MNALTLISQDSVQALGWMLVHFLWQGLAVAAGLALARVFLTDAGRRYAAGCLAMLAMVATPVLTLLAHDIETAPTPWSAGLPGGTATAQGSMSTTDAESLRPAVPSPASAGGWSLPTRQDVREAMPAVVLCWMAGVLLLSLRLLGGGWLCYRLKRRGTSSIPLALQIRAGELARRMNIRRRIRLLASSASSVPMVVGAFRPVILMPVSMFLGLAPDQLEAILLHELAHIRRHDNLINLLQHVVETMFFFHPAVWWVSASIRTEREHCCDDVAAAASDPWAYAGSVDRARGVAQPASGRGRHRWVAPGTRQTTAHNPPVGERGRMDGAGRRERRGDRCFRSHRRRRGCLRIPHGHNSR